MLSRRSFLSLTGAGDRAVGDPRLGAARPWRRRARRPAAAEHRGADLDARPAPSRSPSTSGARASSKRKTADGASRRSTPSSSPAAPRCSTSPACAGATANGCSPSSSRRSATRTSSRPAFEEDRAREQLALGPLEHTDVAIWQEDESPFERVAAGPEGSRHRHGTRRHRGDVEVRVRRQHRRRGAGAEGRERDAGHRRLPDDQGRARGRADARSPAQATLKCYEAVFKALKPGMTQNDVSGLIGAGLRPARLPGFASVQVGEYTALPHGSITPQTIREGTIIMIDDGCTVEGLPVGHHAHVRARQGHRQDEEGLRHRPPGADRGAQGGAARRAARSDRRRRPQGRSSTPATDPASSTSRTASATAWAWTATSGRTW